MQLLHAGEYVQRYDGMANDGLRQVLASALDWVKKRWFGKRSENSGEMCII